jgi:hypothetical protein
MPTPALDPAGARRTPTRRLQTGAAIGAGLVFLGEIGPLATVPLLGPVDAWTLRHGSVFMLAGLVVLTFALIRGGRLRWTWLPGILALAVGTWTLGHAQPPAAGPGGTGVGVQRAVTSLLTGEYRIGWGLGGIVLGCLVLCFTAGMAAVRGGAAERRAPTRARTARPPSPNSG